MIVCIFMFTFLFLLCFRSQSNGDLDAVESVSNLAANYTRHILWAWKRGTHILEHHEWRDDHGCHVHHNSHEGKDEVIHLKCGIDLRESPRTRGCCLLFFCDVRVDDHHEPNK